MSVNVLEHEHRSAFVQAVGHIFDQLEGWYDQYADSQLGNQDEEGTRAWLSQQMLMAISQHTPSLVIPSPEARNQEARTTWISLPVPTSYNEAPFSLSSYEQGLQPELSGICLNLLA
jgi:hypothetical protein